MLSGPAWLALEVPFVDRARAFYAETLALPIRRAAEGELVLGAGDTDLVLREPGPVPRGGLHVHYAFSIPPASYEDWWDRLATDFDLSEHHFGDITSLYCFDPVCNCVELGQNPAVESTAPDASRPAPIAGVFEVVLEVEHLDRAERFYRSLGFDVVDRGDERRRVRLSVGDLDLELWEPQHGLADARGGVHVDLGLVCSEPAERSRQLTGQATEVTDPDRGRRLRDPDGHWITLVPPGDSAV